MPFTPWWKNRKDTGKDTFSITGHKPCPFCGSENLLVHDWIDCKDCGASGPLLDGLKTWDERDNYGNLQDQHLIFCDDPFYHGSLKFYPKSAILESTGVDEGEDTQ